MQALAKAMYESTRASEREWEDLTKAEYNFWLVAAEAAFKHVRSNHTSTITAADADAAIKIAAIQVVARNMITLSASGIGKHVPVTATREQWLALIGSKVTHV